MREREPFLVRIAGRMVDAAIGMLTVLCGVGIVGRQHGWTLDAMVGWVFALTVLLAVAGFALALAGAVLAGRKR